MSTNVKHLRRGAVAILNGVDNEGEQLCAPMPLFGHLDGSIGLSPDDAQAIVAYLRSLSIVSNQVADTPSCILFDAGIPTDAAVDSAADASDGS